jgi:hypothetical protein
VTLGITADPGSMVTAGMPVPVSTDPAHEGICTFVCTREGTGAIGCVSVNAPQFLTEEEAKEIIKAELHAAGIGLRTVMRLRTRICPRQKPFRTKSI